MGAWSSYVDWVGNNIWGYDQPKLCQGETSDGDYDDLCTEVTPPPARSADFNEWLEKGQALLAKLVASKTTTRLYNKSSEREHVGFCFPGDAYLQKSNGSLINFKDLSVMANEGKELPEVASFDEESSSVVYQRPTKVIEHGMVNSTLLYLGLADDIGMITPLMVTANHQLLVDRNEERVWVPAGELENGDELVGPDGVYAYEHSATLAIQGSFELFDISFSTPDHSLKPTFLVSPDGTFWFVAHNKMY